MTDREVRLRLRIDHLSDRARTAEDRVAALEERLARWRRSAYLLRNSRDLWKLRAKQRLVLHGSATGRKS